MFIKHEGFLLLISQDYHQLNGLNNKIDASARSKKFPSPLRIPNTQGLHLSVLLPHHQDVDLKQ